MSQQKAGVLWVCSDLDFLQITTHLLPITYKKFILNHAHKQKLKGIYAMALMSEKSLQATNGDLKIAALSHL